MRQAASFASLLVFAFTVSSSATAAPPAVAAPAVAPPAVAAPASADTTTAAVAKELIHKKLIVPMSAREERSSRFSRARMPPRDRQTRVLDGKPTEDAHGAAFVAFAVDEKPGYDPEGPWRTDAIVGCVYLADGAVFVKQGDGYRSGAALAGKKTQPAPAHVCQAAPITAAASVPAPR